MKSGISSNRSRLTLIAAGAAGLLAVACGSSAPTLPTGLGSLFSPSSHGSSTSAPAGNGAWSAPVKVDSTGTQGLSGASCASSSFCVAIDAAGNAFVYTGTWSTATNIDSTIPAGNDSEINLQSVSCASASFCVVGDSKANVMIYNGSSWSQPQSIDPNTGAGFFSVSCATATFCMAVDGAANAISFNGTTWSTPAPIDPNSSELSSELT